MRKIAIFLIIVLVIAVVQETEQQECSKTHCEGRGRFKGNCDCGCHNCCVRKYKCRGGDCKRFGSGRRKCYCFNCRGEKGFPPKKDDIDKDSKTG
ncbi:uncharacterized protein LOC127708823 [Mytilus californianus]|uniref:uncharacterized protein LOC127708823 n=1 Tax=Mytilus californianus TaxID=6549 RepID=UPI0022455393|nr:uncharacterized protein LOC127708823 [Mytilus californianus]